MADSRPLSRILASAAALLMAGAGLSACGDGFEPNRDGLVTALTDVTELTPEEAACVADSLEYTDAAGTDITDEVLKDLADGSKAEDSGHDVTVEQFEQDLARAIADC